MPGGLLVTSKRTSAICGSASLIAEAMTASFYRVPFEICDDIAAAIKAALPQIADVLFDVTNKPPGTIEWE